MKLQVTMTFTPEDLALIQRNGTTVPNFWPTMQPAPAQGDVLRFGGRQYSVMARVWETDELGIVLRLYMGDGSPASDAQFH